jgi:hypothetical protein
MFRIYASFRTTALGLLLSLLASACMVVYAPDMQIEPETLYIPVNSYVDDDWTLVLTDLHGWESTAFFTWTENTDCVSTIEAIGPDGSVFEGSRFTYVYRPGDGTSVDFATGPSVIFDPVIAPGCEPFLESVWVHHIDLGGDAAGPYPRTAGASWRTSRGFFQPVASTAGPIAGHWKDAERDVDVTWLPQGGLTAEFTWPEGEQSCPYEVAAYVDGAFVGSAIRPWGSQATADDASVEIGLVLTDPGTSVKFRFSIDHGSCKEWRTLDRINFQYA